MYKLRGVLLLTIMLFVNLSTYSQKQAEATKSNLGFEEIDKAAGLPESWWKGGDDFSVSLDSTVKRSGKYSILIEKKQNFDNSSFAMLLRYLPNLYEGKTIELRGYMKLENAGGNSGFMVRIDGRDAVIQFDNMANRNIKGTSDWKLYSIKLPLSNKDRTIAIGPIRTGTGKVWFDDFEVLIDGKDISEAKIKELNLKPAEKDNEFSKGSKISFTTISNEQIQSLALLCKIWGFVKYYHPAVADGLYNMDFELFRILPNYLEAKSSDAHNAIISDWITKMGTFAIEDNPVKLNQDSIKLLPDFKWMDSKEIRGSKLHSQLAQIKNAKRKNQHYYLGFNFAGNVRFENESPYSYLFSIDTGFRILSLFRYWNYVNYFFPYKNLIDGDWNKALTELLPRFVSAQDELGYKLAALELIGKISDSHAGAFDSKGTLQHFFGDKFTPYQIVFIENKPVISKIAKDFQNNTPLQIGDVITSVNGEKTEDIIKRYLPYTPASNYPTQLRNLSSKFLRTSEDSILVTFERNGKENKCKIGCIPNRKVLFNNVKKEKKAWEIIQNNIGYINAEPVKRAEVPNIMKEFKDTKGIIIDMRCYPVDFIGLTLINYFIPNPRPFAKFTRTDYSNPGLFRFFHDMTAGEINPDYYKNKVVIIVNEQTQSSAEFQTMALRTISNVTVVGSTTAGADGNISEFLLPGNISTAFSGIGVYYPDRKETQRVGVGPEVEVKPTIKGFREGRDELLEAAIKIIKNN